MDPHELRLATSRNLYSVAMHYDYINSGSVDYNEYAVKDMVLGAAPNLKEVYLYQYSSGSDPWTAQAIRAPKELWRSGRIATSAPAPTRGRLERLELINRNINIPLLESWQRSTDLSVLRTLKIYSTVHAQELRWLSENSHLDSLEVIALHLHEANDPVYEEFWQRLPPLKSLRLSGSYGQKTLRAIIDRHAATLETFLLVTPELEHSPEHGSAGFASEDFLHLLRDKFVRIRELAISLMRTEGNEEEVALYRSLGQISTLRKIHLSVYSSQRCTWAQLQPPEQISPSTNFSTFDSAPTYRVFHDVMIDLADEKINLAEDLDLADQLRASLIDVTMDQELAHSIFRVISTARSEDAQNLDHLVLRMGSFDHFERFDDDNPKTLFSYIGLSWICDRSLRDDIHRDCDVREYDPEESIERQFVEDEGYLADIANGPLRPILHELWPASRDREWKDVWHSFPLAID
ncbi:hypothetical protein KC331_g2221 [Hortaea werneckii]|nr:hypothetical protein KC331_g2221 [Hortaea werneckii]KAI7722129.1 hypothetical protein KC353_g765 [Hortaea werneckii]